MMYALDLSDADLARRVIDYAEHAARRRLSPDERLSLIESVTDWSLGYIVMIVRHVGEALR